MTKKVLLVEDDAFLYKVFSAHLEREGIQSTTITDGGKALAAAKRLKPNLILLDIGLPNRDGFQILEDLKKGKTTKDIPVFLVTKHGDTVDRERNRKTSPLTRSRDGRTQLS
jgi:DNA-binding response OmpR family regulator